MATTASKLARLSIDGKEYNVFQAFFESTKPVDQWNRVTAYATKADAQFVIEGKDDTLALFDKYANSRNRFNAKLTLYNTHDEAKLSETEFNDCSITQYTSKYNASDEVPYTITVTISPKVTKEGSAELTFDQNT
jgi:hypothetical protein